jgi:hypothetical protein
MYGTDKLTLTILVKLADKLSSSLPSEAASVSVSSQDVSISFGVCRSPENDSYTLRDMHL